MFGNECLGELGYEGITAAILMAGLFISFLIEYIAQRAIKTHATKAEGEEFAMSAKDIAKAEFANISIMEAGIIFHSLRKHMPSLFYMSSLFSLFWPPWNIRC